MVPQGPRARPKYALVAAIGVRRPLPVAAHQHFIPRGWPSSAMGLISEAPAIGTFGPVAERGPAVTSQIESRGASTDWIRTQPHWLLKGEVPADGHRSQPGTHAAMGRHCHRALSRGAHRGMQ